MSRWHDLRSNPLDDVIRGAQGLAPEPIPDLPLFQWWDGDPGPDTQAADHGVRMTVGSLIELLRGPAPAAPNMPVRVALDGCSGIVTDVWIIDGELVIGQLDPTERQDG